MSHTLLLADDSVTIQRVIELTFADEDIQVVAVTDGDEAIARLDAAPPDIVLADIGMPGRNGYEVADYIRQSPRLAHIPVVLLTGAFEPVDQMRAAAVGCAGVLAKPFEPQLVISRVKELLAQSARTPVWLAPDPSLAPVRLPPPAGRENADDYFDRLDAAFASLSGGSPSEPPGTAASIPHLPDELDWYGSRLPASPAPTATSREISPARASALSVAPVPSFPKNEIRARAARPPLPPLADAFAALLAAEQGTTALAAVPTWPATPIEPLVTDDLIEQVTRRVIDRLSIGVVRETVAEVVSATAERLVCEEIERIKASIK